MSQLRMGPDSIRWSEYPSWIVDLIPVHDLTVALFVVRDLEPVQAMKVIGAGDQPIQPVQLPIARPSAPYSSRAHIAVGAQPYDYAMLATRVQDWTMVLDTSGQTFGDEATALSRDGREAASCAVNPALDTRLTYAVAGDRRLALEEPVSAVRMKDLPRGLRSAARDSGAYAPRAEHRVWGATQNLALICALAGLDFSSDDLYRLPLIGTKLEGFCYAAHG